MRAHGIRINQGADRPSEHELGLVSGHLQTLRRLEDDRPEGSSGQETPGSRHCPVEAFAAEHQGEPDEHDDGEAHQRRDEVKIAGHQPDQADDHQRPTQAEGELGEAEAVLLDIPTADRRRGRAVDQPVPLPAVHFLTQKSPLRRGDRRCQVGRSGSRTGARVIAHGGHSTGSRAKRHEYPYSTRRGPSRPIETPRLRTSRLRTPRLRTPAAATASDRAASPWRP